MSKGLNALMQCVEKDYSVRTLGQLTKQTPFQCQDSSSIFDNKILIKCICIASFFSSVVNGEFVTGLFLFTSFGK